MGLLELNWTSAVQLLLFLLLMYVLYKFLYKPFFQITEERRKKIEQEIKEAERLRSEAEQLKSEMETQLKKARETADEIINRARKEAEKIVTDAKEKAKSEASRIIDSARAQMETEKREMMAELEKKAGELAVAMAMRILKGVLDEKAKREYLKRMIEKEMGE